MDEIWSKETLHEQAAIRRKLYEVIAMICDHQSNERERAEHDSPENIRVAKCAEDAIRAAIGWMER